MSHTPGPWTYHLEADGEYFSLSGANKEEIVAGCGCCSSPWCRNQDDARLIAAAPELLAVVQHILQCIPMGGFAQIHHDSSTWAQLDAVIAKATGGAT